MKEDKYSFEKGDLTVSSLDSGDSKLVAFSKCKPSCFLNNVHEREWKDRWKKIAKQEGGFAYLGDGKFGKKIGITENTSGVIVEAQWLVSHYFDSSRRYNREVILPESEAVKDTLDRIVSLQ